MPNPDLLSKFEHALTLIRMIRDSKAEEVRKQHIDALERILVLIDGALKAEM